MKRKPPVIVKRLQKAGRDVRYWNARRASAVVMPVPTSVDTVHFGHAVTIVRDDARKQTFRIVGEDAADPAQGSSPTCRRWQGR